MVARTRGSGSGDVVAQLQQRKRCGDEKEGDEGGENAREREREREWE